MTNVPGAPGAADSGTAPEPVGERKVSETLHFARRNPKLLIGTGVVLVLLLTGLVGPLFIDHGPNVYVGPKSQPPSSEYWMGTTSFGQDIWAQFVYGLRSTFLVGALGGAAGALFVVGAVLVVPRTGVAVFFICVVLGQVLGAAVLDQFGAFGLDSHAITWPRVLGILLLLVGVALTQAEQWLTS
jgi:hypothetical protein